MEIALLPKNAIKIKGKQATVVVNPTDAQVPHQAALFLRNASVKIDSATVPISGPGEYEIGGIKISGVKNKENTVYSINVDDLDILIGDLPVVEKLQHKLKEHHIVLIQTTESSDASFVNGLASNVVMLYGETAKEVIEKFAKEGMQEMSKFQATKDKLPPEIQTILLA